MMNIPSLRVVMFAALWMLVGAPLAEAEIYTWKDADGKVHFDKKPEGSGATSVDVRVNTITSPSISTANSPGPVRPVRW